MMVISGVTTGGDGADGIYFILFNYKILSRFVALIYFVVNEKILSAF